MIRLLAAASLGATSLIGVALPASSGAVSSSVVHVAGGGGLFVPTPAGLHPAPAVVGGSTTAEESENWSGYIRSGSSGAYSASAASWTVPTLSTKYKGYSSTWVGIDGASSGDDYLIQTGTEADVVGGRASYDAWWEVITPSDEAPEVVYNSIHVSPGDAITASVKKSTGGKWVMKLTDVTTGAVGTHTSSFAGPGKSGEWIQEDTDVNNAIQPAPDWHSVTFKNITLDGANPDLKAGAAVDIVDGAGVQEDSTGAPNSTDNGFTVTWLANGTATPIG